MRETGLCSITEAVGQGLMPLPQREELRLAGPRPMSQEGGKTGTPLLGDIQGGHTPAQDTAEQERREKQGKSRKNLTAHSTEKGSSDISKVWWGSVTISVTWSGLDFCGGGLNCTLIKDGGPPPTPLSDPGDGSSGLHGAGSGHPSQPLYPASPGPVLTPAPSGWRLQGCAFTQWSDCLQPY